MNFDPSPTSRSGEFDASALGLTLRALRPLLDNHEVMELCINKPHEAFVETQSGWRREALAFADFDWCSRLAKLIANSSQQRIDATSPLLSASLPTGERVQIAMPPATTPGCVAIAVRCPAERVWSIEELASRGIFRRAHLAGQSLDSTEEELLGLLE
jgi:type IV secretion system protein VirB11